MDTYASDCHYPILKSPAPIGDSDICAHTHRYEGQQSCREDCRREVRTQILLHSQLYVNTSDLSSTHLMEHHTDNFLSIRMSVEL